jgi:hypothetical protein
MRAGVATFFYYCKAGLSATCITLRCEEGAARSLLFAKFRPHRSEAGRATPTRDVLEGGLAQPFPL